MNKKTNRKTAKKKTVKKQSGDLKGHLQMCVDRRFVHPLQKEFESLTGLKSGDYWVSTAAGGSPKMDAPPKAKELFDISPDYAYENGATMFAWCAHGSICGGYGGKAKGVKDVEILKELIETFHGRVSEFPNAEHWAIFITDTPKKGTIWRMGPIKL